MSNLVDWFEKYGPIHIELPPERSFPYDFYDLVKVLEMGAKKHGNLNWLDENGNKSDHKSMHASMFRHLADSHANNRVDHESGLDPLLHLACRALMMYVRIKKGIVHDLDKVSEEETFKVCWRCQTPISGCKCGEGPLERTVRKHNR